MPVRWRGRLLARERMVAACRAFRASLRGKEAEERDMFNWLGDFFRARRRQLRAQAPHIERLAAHNSHQLNPPLDLHSARVYEQSPWVYIAINRIAEAGALVPLQVYRLEGERRIGISNHPLERLLNNPNPLTSRFELLEQTLGAPGAAGQRLLVPGWRRHGQPARDLAAAPGPRQHRARSPARDRWLSVRDRWAAHPPGRH